MGTNEHHHTDAVTQAGIGMDGAQLPQREPAEPTVREGHEDPTEIDAEPIPIQADQETDNELAGKGRGDQDNDGNTDNPHDPFPG